MLGSDSLRTDCWLVGRLDGVSFDGQGAFSFVDDVQDDASSGEQKGLSFLERMYIGGLRTHTRQRGDNDGRHSVWE